MRRSNNPVWSRSNSASQSEPQILYDIPTSPVEHALQFIDDSLVPTHRPVESLEIAVHNEDQVIQLLPRTQRDRTQRIHLIRLAVTQKRPHLPICSFSSFRFSRYRMNRA